MGLRPRPPRVSENIRTWGQLGLTGEWADKPIQTYGYAPTGMSNFFELAVFHGGTKWNPNLRQYVETSAKQATTHAGTTDQMMDDLSHDRYGIAWAGLAHADGKPGVKALALSSSSSGPFIECTETTVRNRTYPLPAASSSSSIARPARPSRRASASFSSTSSAVKASRPSPHKASTFPSPPAKRNASAGPSTREHAPRNPASDHNLQISNSRS